MSVDGLTLDQEARAHVEWDVFGCPNGQVRLTRTPENTNLIIRVFDKKRISRGEAWRIVESGDRWTKCHTRRTWCWYIVEGKGEA